MACREKNEMKKMKMLRNEMHFLSCSLDPPPLSQQYIGNSFALPHRDFNFTESNDPDGRPKMLSIWVPVTDATLNNGCMYVLPGEGGGDACAA